MILDDVLEMLAHDPNAPCDLAELALHLARDEYPCLDVEGYLAELDAMAGEARSYVRGDFPARVAGLCRYLFHELGFHGNVRDYYDPRNSYLNEVLDRRTGIPITLSVVAMAIGKRADLEVVGVGLPGHIDVNAVTGEESILFDPFHGGRMLSQESCEQLVEQVTGVPFLATPKSFDAFPTGRIAARMLTNLKGKYLKDGDHVRAARVIARLRQLHPDDWFERRDLGITLLHAGRPGSAIDHLEAYLNAFPHGTDATAVRGMLEQAKSAVSKWN